MGKRLGIRGKLLSSSGATIVLIVLLELLAQRQSARAGKEIEERVARYHAIHRLRVALSEHRSLSERYLREGQDDVLKQVQEGLIALEVGAEGLEPFSAESLDAYFEVRATRRGIEAYLPLVASAVARRASLLPDYWAPFARAERIATYTDGYLTKLLSLSLKAGEARYREISERSEAMRRLALVGILGAGLSSLAFSFAFANSIAAPIRRLAQASERIAAGELGVKAEEPRSDDEVAVLARGFNAMSANIRSLVEGLKEKAELEGRLHEEEMALVSMGRALREAQFMNLQDQMRPHFLFNALNTIARSALLEGAGATERLAHGLGRLMRYALASGEPFVSLGEELEVIREYLSFQAIRFGNRLTWEIRVEPGLEDRQIPRFTLQPIVENAVRHGIEPRLEGGKVVVTARRRARRVRIMVGDSGIGMEPELLARLRAAAAGRDLKPPAEATTPGEEGPGIGLANMEMRLAYRYGDKARVVLASRQGRGTIIRISLPTGGG